MNVRRIASTACVLSLAACAGSPPPPDWQANAHAALQAHVADYLTGRDKAAAQELAVARREVARTGDAQQMARVELTACAARLASLVDVDLADCPGYAPLARDAGAEASAYAAYLAGRWTQVDPERLPDAQRLALRAPDAPAALREIADPFSRLVAAGALLRAARLPPAGIALAIDTAAGQGWRRALLAWLGLDARRRDAAGDAEGAAAQRRRIDRASRGQSRGQAFTF